MDRVASECAAFLLNHINQENCLELRRNMGAIMSRLPEMAASVDDFIDDNMDRLRESRPFISLPRICVEVRSSLFYSIS
jgi:hypothetical protein